MKNLLFNHFLEVLELDKTIGLTDAQKRAVCNTLALSGTTIHDDNFKKMNEMYQELVISDEKTRSQFIGLINFIEKTTKVLLDSFKKQGLIKLEYSPIKKKTTIKARSSVLEEVAEYLNVMNDLVIKFYEDVYKIEKVSDKEKELIQSSLF